MEKFMRNQILIAALPSAVFTTAPGHAQEINYPSNLHISFFGEFMWQGLPANQAALAPLINQLIAAGLPNILSDLNSA
jgi:hypothetical protein